MNVVEPLTVKPKAIITLKAVLEEFISLKQHAKVRSLTIEQLNQRTGLTINCVSRITSADAVRFRDHLYKEGEATKLIKRLSSLISLISEDGENQHVKTAGSVRMQCFN